VTAEEIVKREPDLIIGSWCGKRGESLEQACSSCSVAHSPYQIFDNPVIGYSEPVAARARARSAMVASIRATRRWYAEELRFVAHLHSPAVIAAFANVPRERFVGPGPWRIKSPMDLAEYWTTEDADPRAVYHDVLIALDEVRGINIGQPSLWASLFDQLDITAGEEVLHLGCGAGYYTAIAAELVGSAGKVTAIEINARLAELARIALSPWPWVSVLLADGSTTPFDAADAIIVSAGATHPLPSWLMKSLRREPDQPDETCWLAGEGWWAVDGWHLTSCNPATQITAHLRGGPERTGGPGREAT